MTRFAGLDPAGVVDAGTASNGVRDETECETHPFGKSRFIWAWSVVLKAILRRERIEHRCADARLNEHDRSAINASPSHRLDPEQKATGVHPALGKRARHERTVQLIACRHVAPCVTIPHVENEPREEHGGDPPPPAVSGRTIW
jgi:hypothetical protein